MRPLVKYHGGKGRIFKWIVPLLPDHLTYCEPFGGAASVLLNKRKSNREIYSDLEETIVNLMSVVKNDLETFKNIVEKIPYSKEVYLKYRDVYFSNGFKNLSSVDKAVVTYVTKRMSRGGLCGTFSWSSRIYSTGPAEVHCWNSALNNLNLVHKRLKDVELYCDNAFNILKKYDSRDTLFYLDPPYLQSSRVSPNVYLFEMTENQHCELAEICNGLQGKVLLSGYPSDLYNHLYKDWRCERKETPNHSSHSKKKEKKIECLWMNF